MRDVFKDKFELYSRKHNYDSLNRERYFYTPCDFYNFVIVEYFSTNHLLTSPHFDVVALFTKFKKVKKIMPKGTIREADATTLVHKLLAAYNNK